MEALKCHTTSEFWDQTCPKTGRYSIKKLFTHHLLFSLKCYLSFSGSSVNCELDSIMQAGKKKIQQQIRI
jgi:hypothetical protein